MFDPSLLVSFSILSFRLCLVLDKIENFNFNFFFIQLNIYLKFYMTSIRKVRHLYVKKENLYCFFFIGLFHF
jgi:hypothetical protein